MSAAVRHEGLVATTSFEDWPPDHVVATKGPVRVAVVLPAHNESKTVGDIVASIVGQYVGVSARLVDDVVVVDSASTDDTAMVAARAGARVVSSPRPGKGEAMWQGLAATDADVVVYIDADLEDFDHRYVPVLVGPLLADPAVHFVKGCYDRPIHEGTMRGGGRVTELMARPLLSAFWPELASIIQPLSGEYAVRRSLLERLPYRCGYGVDIGLLIDAYSEVGIGGFAQVDLERRQHRHSDLDALGRMAAEILHTALDRLAVESRISCDLALSSALVQPRRIMSESVLDVHEIDQAERPPLRLLSTAATAADEVLTGLTG